jgi:hypothetical protein
MREPRVFPFRWVLPLAQLFLCAVILRPFWVEMDRELRASLREYGLTRRSAEKIDNRPAGSGSFDLDLDSIEARRAVRRMELREWIVAALNGPGSVPDLIYTIVSPAHSEWVPRGMFMWTWRETLAGRSWGCSFGGSLAAASRLWYLPADSWRGRRSGGGK